VLARVNRELHELIARRATELARCTEMDDRATSFSASEFARQHAAVSLVAASVRTLDGAINVKAAEAALARVSWASARQRLHALERLEERGREEWLIAAQRHEANELDEMATAAFVRELQASEAAAP
jgi:flagellar export protein FliJ